ncbi:MAG: hypothetical protein V1848_02915 [Candidatus Magasanikbacteria bacterium]
MAEVRTVEIRLAKREEVTEVAPQGVFKRLFGMKPKTLVKIVEREAPVTIEAEVETVGNGDVVTLRMTEAEATKAGIMHLVHGLALPALERSLLLEVPHTSIRLV